MAAPESEHPTLSQPTELSGGDYDPANPPDRLRVLVALGPSTYFFANGRPHGVEFAMLSELEKYLNRTRPKGRAPLRIQYVPVDAGALLPKLRDGEGDLAAGLIPVIAGAGHLAEFTVPYLNERWCLVQNRSKPPLTKVEDLGERAVTIPAASYGRRVMAGELASVKVVEPPLGTSTEQLFAQIQRGGDTATVASDYVLGLWSQRYPALKSQSCAAASVPVAWAVAPEHPQLLSVLNRFIASTGGKLASKAAGDTRRFLPKDARADAPDEMSSTDKLGFFAPMLQLVAAANNLDWLLLAAIGQRETKLQPMTRKGGGPTGLMQVNPNTARKMGVSNPHDTEQNVTAAARYLTYLRRLFSDRGITPTDQLYFMIASYNAGEGRVQQLRKKAKAQGLDPNVWRGNVEEVARRTVGQHLLDYVSSVNRYYLAYQAADRSADKREASKPAR
ncbi:lytic transglycosylase F [Jeongeupia sp. HS-3]|uniref:transglycosylase SLT domain-containing protein n=1 Tax=Jeongeupia sp. HS-3 TaxID=1009682 RepID=UPI0018A5BF49|nr:transglycosylase SLT domain-containing protein [Jeongeupia sp. HS-3]BCL75407.1 lytic transglycosylase F [Jeongeupia sp. HS-3]